jgi:predicted AAA+ superfamily ATPase
MVLNSRITPGVDLLFFDEIQACPNAITSLRYFYEERPDLHVIAAGSLLEFALKNVGFPVGRVNLMELCPMNFYEFLMAADRDDLASVIAEPPRGLSKPVHELLLSYLRHYMFTGGMPECITTWLRTGSLKEVFSVQADLLSTFRQDFSKYTPLADPRALNFVLGHVSKHIGNQIKYSIISDDFTGPTHKKALSLLETARILHKVSSTSPASLPFEANASEKRFKSIMLDMSLIHALNGLQAHVEYTRPELLSMYTGGLTEQFVGQEFISAGYNPLFYWSREAKSSQAEVDYLIVKHGKIVPVEVKSGASGSLRSMHQLLQQYPDIEQGIVLSSAPYGTLDHQKMVFLPLYYAYGLIGGSHS